MCLVRRTLARSAFHGFLLDSQGEKACKSCRSRQELSNEYSLAKTGLDKAEKEPSQSVEVIRFIFSIHSLGAAKSQPRTLRDRAAYQLLRIGGRGGISLAKIGFDTAEKEPLKVWM